MVEEGVEAVAGGVLAGELPADLLGQRSVGAHRVAQASQAGVQGRAIPPQRVVRVGARGIDDVAVGEDHHQRPQRVVAVLHDAAAHPRGVVGHDPAQHGRVDGGGVGPEPPAHRREQPVDVAAHHAGLTPHARAAVQDSHALPERGQLHQDVVGHGLARQRRTARAEGQVPAVPAGIGEEGLHLGDAARPHHRPRDEPVDRGVHRPAEEVDGPGQHPLGGEDAAEVADERGVAGDHDARATTPGRGRRGRGSGRPCPPR